MNDAARFSVSTLGIVFVGTAIAQPLDQIYSYISETSRLINQSSIQATNTIRKVQKTDDLLLPKDWKLVSVVPVSKVGSNEQEFMLFFQDSKSNVHSIGISAGGMVTGRNSLKIKASE